MTKAFVLRNNQNKHDSTYKYKLSPCIHTVTVVVKHDVELLILLCCVCVCVQFKGPKSNQNHNHLNSKYFPCWNIFCVENQTNYDQHVNKLIYWLKIKPVAVIYVIYLTFLSCKWRLLEFLNVLFGISLKLLLNFKYICMICVEKRQDLYRKRN